MKSTQPLLSVVIPAYNEAQNIAPVHTHLTSVLATLPSYEVIYVNDGSQDGTLAELHKLAKTDPHVRIISFSRNFGKEQATSAGLHHAHGQASIMFDADGQFPAELIPQFVAKWQAGAQVVTGVRIANQKEGLVKRYGSRLFYKLFNSISKTQSRPGATDFRLIDQTVRDEFLRFTERGRITRGLLDWVGFNEDFIEFTAKPRIAGEAAYSFSKLFTLALNSFISLSRAPLYFSAYAGFIITPLSFLLGVFVLVEQFLFDDPWHLNFTGTAMLGILVLFFVGILLISQGLIALYISHIHAETQNRPLYIINRHDSVRLENDDAKA